MKKIILLLMIAIFISMNSYAGFPIGKGKTIYSFAFNYFYSNKNFDKDWHIYNSGSNFSSYYLSLFVAHGLTRRWDVFGSLPYIIEKSYGGQVNLSRNDFADFIGGISYTVPNKLFNKYTSFKLSGITPLSHGNTPLPISYDANGIDFTVNYTNSAKYHGKGYFSIEGAYRHYYAADGPNQYYLDYSRFRTLGHYFYLTYGASATLSNSITKDNYSTPNSTKDFFSVQAKLILCKKVRRNVTLYLEGFYTPIGRNTGVGTGVNFFTVLRMP